MPKRHIPEAIKRAVRQRCAFGCVICGLPIFDYDHIEEFADVQEHTAENIVLLCPLHHGEKTRGRLSKDVVRKHASAPANRGRQRSANHLHLMTGNRGRFEAGNCVHEFDFTANANRFDAITMFGKTVLGLSAEDGYLLLDISLTDKNGLEILRIDRGELSVSTGVWDYKIRGQTIQMRSSQHFVSLEMTLKPDGVTLRNGLFLRHPYLLVIDPDKHVLWRGNVKQFTFGGGSQKSLAKNCRYGLVIG